MSNAYAQGQLGSALLTAAVHEDAATRRRAERRVRAWTSVLEGLDGGWVSVGSRTPVAGLPAWVTLEVLRGGFATGKPMAGGPLEQDEIARATHLGIPHTRSAIFASYLTDNGLRELGTLVGTGGYEVRIPEDGVLLVVAHLALSGDRAGALEVLDSVRPLVDVLRFMPRAAPPRTTPPDQVSRRTAAQVREQLAGSRPRPQVEKQREALEVWLPLTDRFVGLWWSSKNDEGWTGAHTALARTLTDAYDQAFEQYTQCRKYRDPKENLPILVSATRARLEGDFTEGSARRVEHVLSAIVAKRGEPDGEITRALRSEQAKIAAAPSHRRLAEVAAGRCAEMPVNEGISDISAILVPVTDGEAEEFGVPAGERMPAAVGRKVRLATTGTVESLVADGVVPSAEVLAELVPALTSQQMSAAYDHDDLGRLAGATYEAFRRRRSLLLLDLNKQVQFEELPWVSALTPHAVASGAERSTAVARRVAALAIDSFPGTILPNPLIQELTTLYEAAGQSLPLTPELAADIFMGRFSARFATAAQVAATMLWGTLYERYYGLPFEPLLNVTRKDFGQICTEAAQGVEGVSRWSPSRNGVVIERQQVLTTQNLAVLVKDGGVRPSRSWPDLALAAALHCARLLRVAQGQQRPLPTIKDAAYAWRQAVFFLTMAGADEHVTSFVDAVRETADGAAWPMTDVLEGLRFVGEGGTFDSEGRSPGGRRLLGWTMTRHWAAPLKPAG